MSGIFGIYHPDNQPIIPAHLKQMASSIAHRGPDGTKTFIQDHIGFGHSMLQTTPESLQEHLPYIDVQNKLAITSDARIDNRIELAKSLDIKDFLDIPDSQLILLAYLKWGVESFIRLIGDFAFVIWDYRKRQLICVRDYIGVKPFYYHHSASQFLFSSEIKQLAEHPDISLAVNKNMVAEYLSFSFCSKIETLFQNIYRLAPGSFLKISQQDITTYKYWSFKSGKKLFYKNSSEYTEHFLEIFQTAVKSRLRSNTIVSAELSGGLDSSCVVGMACNILKSQNKPAPETYGMIFPDLNFDEQHYIQSVSKKFNLSTHYIKSHRFTETEWFKQSINSFEPPDMPNFSIRNLLIQKISNTNSRVLLSGIGGDEWFSGSGFPYLDFIKHHKYSALLAQLLYSMGINKKTTIKRFLVNLSWPLIPKIIRQNICNYRNNCLPSWLSDSVLLQTNLRYHLPENDLRPNIPNLGDLSLFQITKNATEVFFLEAMDRYHAKHHIEYRSPFLDRRVAEFALLIPDYERQQKGVSKFLLRNQSNTLLPERIRKRQSKAEFSYFFGKVFSSSLFTRNTNNLTMSYHGWINQEQLRKSLIEKQNNFKKNNYLSGNMNWETWFVFAIEMWYKSAFKKDNYKGTK